MMRVRFPSSAPTSSSFSTVGRIVHSVARAQHPVAAWRVRQASAIRAGVSSATRRRSASREIVWMLSKFTTLSEGTPSSGVNSSSDTSPRRVRVSAATTTAPIRSATGSRVSTKTGRSPPGVAANQISPRCIDSPIRPVLRGPPVRDLGKRPFPVVKWGRSPTVGVPLRGKPVKVTAQRFAQQFRPVLPERFSPSLRFVGFAVINSKAEHCHTNMLRRMTADRRSRPASALRTTTVIPIGGP